MKAEVKKLFLDIKESIESIDSYLGENKDYKIYLQDKMLRRAVERELEIIGEAMNKIQKLDKNLKIENQTKIINLRNRVIHAYDSIDNEIVWGVVTRHIPLLKQEIDELIEKNE